MLAQYSSTVYIRSDSQDINIDGEVNANRNSFLRIRDSNKSDANDVNISGDVEVYHNSGIRLRNVNSSSLIGVYHNSSSEIQDSRIGGMNIWLGSTARMLGDSTTNGDITLHGSSSEINFRDIDNSDNADNYLNSNNLNLCNNTNYINKYTAGNSGQSLHGGTVMEYTGSSGSDPCWD